MKIKDVMVKPVTVSGNAPITKVRHLMGTKVREVLVLEDDRLVGGISMDELMKVTATKSNIECKGFARSMAITASPEDTSLELAKQLVQASERRAPVLEGGKLVGIINTHCLLSSFLKKGYKPIKKKVSEVMQKKVVTVDYQTELEKVWLKLEDFTGIPVMKKNALVGIVTRADLIAHGKARSTRETERHAKTTAPVERVMTTQPITLVPSAKIEDAAKLAVERDFSMIPVVQDRRLVGVVSQYDILSAYVG